MDNTKLTRMLRAHANIKAKQAAQNKAHKLQAAPLKKALETIETALLNMMNEIGTTQLKVAGLAVVTPSKKIMPNCKDWRALRDHITATGNWDLIARRLSSTHVATYIEEHDGLVPPGISIHTERGVKVTRQN